ncbi:RICIN domain-containing protein [Thermomonospora umbrina]|uniref:Ricin-type beta-trefoil lectin protein n=1 Tax=Thermomonospora umbrina TaxID=111806 RepID=A0A3D9SS06_9ACTN|nr:RICIN domain-containing protein [Thermomonospora umbrina]REE95745.1 ricin-type beta-trefoil lectin protein [Thermomonospora umbrina]
MTQHHFRRRHLMAVVAAAVVAGLMATLPAPARASMSGHVVPAGTVTGGPVPKFRWVSAYDGRCVDADANRIGVNGARVQLWDCNYSSQQLWRRESAARIRNGHGTRRCLDADLGTIEDNGTRVQLWACNGRSNQRWRITGRDAWGWEIRNAHSGRCLDADPTTVGSRGSKVQLWDCNGSPHQRWRIRYF